MSTTAQIKSKGLADTGVTEEIARSYFNRLGSTHLAIVEYRVDARTVDADGDQKVQLSISALEPVIDGGLNGALSEHVRNIQKALWRNRGEEQPLDGVDGDAPTVDDLTRQGNALLEHDDDGEVTGTWDGTDPGESDGLGDLDRPAEE